MKLFKVWAYTKEMKLSFWFMCVDNLCIYLKMDTFLKKINLPTFISQKYQKLNILSINSEHYGFRATMERSKFSLLSRN